MPMGVLLRVSEFLRDASLKTLRYKVLQAFRFIMNLVDGIVENLVKKGLDQSMMTNDLQRASLARARKTNPTMPLIVDKGRRGRCEFLCHAGHRCRRNAKLPRQFSTADTLLSTTQMEDRLQIVIHGLCVRKLLSASRHLWRAPLHSLTQSYILD
jgi:hypothetical protein